MVDWIRKGNKSLIPAALRRVKFLLAVVHPDLIKKGVLGDEEALWVIHEFLHNNGWWERARNLNFISEEEELATHNYDLPILDFIQANNHFVDHNVQLMINRGDTEGVRMALNQIHYGSLKAARDGNRSQGTLNNKEKKSDLKQAFGNSHYKNRKNNHSQMQVVKNSYMAFKC